VPAELPPSAALIPVRPGGEMLLQLRDDRPGLPGAGCWSTVGGAVEAGETPEQAASRESEEEIGRRPESLIQIGMRDGPRFRSHLFAAQALWTLDELVVGEGQGVDWLRPEAVSGLPLFGSIGQAIIEFLDSPVYRRLADGRPPGPGIVLPPLPPGFALGLGLRPGQLLALEGAGAAFVRRLWDVLDGARVTASMGENERAGVVLWWPRRQPEADGLACWRQRLAPGGVIWCVPEPGAAARNVLLALAQTTGMRPTGEMLLPTGEPALRLTPDGG
jgi:8-oxo-dGTP diphosphatase